jgi:hypothetical protein
MHKNDRKVRNLSPATAKKLISGGFGASGIPHAIEN